MQNGMPMTIHRSKSKPEIEFQYGGPPFSETGSSYISAVDWYISSKFGTQIDFQLLKQIPSLKPNRKYISDSMADILKIRYDVITPPSIVLLLRNLADGCKMTCRWQQTRRNRNRKYNSNMAAVRFPKPEVVISQSWIEIFYGSLVWKGISGSLDRCLRAVLSAKC